MFHTIKKAIKSARIAVQMTSVGHDADWRAIMLIINNNAINIKE